MPTVRDICTRALRKIDVIGIGDAAEGEEIAEAVDVYNDMLHGWRLRGVDIGHTTQEAGDTFQLPDEFVEGTVYVLASRLSPNFMVPPSFDADDWFRMIQAHYAEIEPVRFERGLTFPPSRYSNRRM